jgi:hypothetical protein
VRERMYKYDWKSGRGTLNWLSPTVALVRVHVSKEHIPGPYEAVVNIVVTDGEFELQGFLGVRPKLSEFKVFYKYLAGLGLREKRRDFRKPL